MKGAFLLFRLSLKRTRPLLSATVFLLAAVQALRVLIAASVHNAGQFDQVSALVPASIQNIIGSAFGSIMTFNGIVCGVYFDLAFIIALMAVVITVATQPASEIETGFADLVLARAFPRHWLITRTIAVVLFAVLLMLSAIGAGTWAGLVLFAPADVSWPAARTTASLATSLGALVVAWSGVAMAFGAACRRGPASMATSLIAFGAWILDWAHRLWPPLEYVAWLSPFYYFDPYGLVAGEPLHGENLLVLFAIAMTGYVVAYFVILQRDISR